MDCVFCKIINKEELATVVYEDNEVLGIKNIYPEAPIHFLFMPKKHIEWKEEIKDPVIFSRLILTAKGAAIEQKIFDACKLIFNIGRTGHFPHVHLHLLGGWKK